MNHLSKPSWLCSLLAFFPLGASADWLYMIDQYRTDSDRTNKLIRVDPDDPQRQLIKQLEFESRYGGMVWLPNRKKLLLVNSRESPDREFTDFRLLDPETGESEFLGALELGNDNLQAFGVAHDHVQDRTYLSFGGTVEGQPQLLEVTLNPLSANWVMDLLPNFNGYDSLEFDPDSGSIIAIPPISNSSTQEVYSIDLDTGSMQLTCTIQLPENFLDDPGDGFDNGDLAYDPTRKVYWHAGVHGDGEPLVQLSVDGECSSNPIPDGAPRFDVAALAYVPTSTDALSINPGLNDAWYNPATSGQGFLITVLPEAGIVFLAWFTYDTERPPGDVEALLGEPGHRWLTAQGPFEGDTALLDIVVSEGGVFDAGDPKPQNRFDGTIELVFTSCNSGVIKYNIPSLGRMGEIPIQRIVPDNVTRCESLQ